MFRACYVGYGRGAATEALHLLGIASATALAANGYLKLSEYAAGSWAFEPSLLHVVCFLLLFLIGLFLVYRVMYRAAALVLREGAHHIVTQWVGLLIGGIRGLWWTGLVLMLLLSLGIAYFAHSIQERALLGPSTLQLTSRAMHEALDRLPGGSRRRDIVPGMTVELPRWPGSPAQDEKPARGR